MRATTLRFLLNVSGESPSFRAKPGLRNLLLDAHASPYKEQFKDFWATPVPFADREFGAKPKLGDPVPARRAATTILAAKNKHADPASVESGAETDYKVLMMYRESKGRMVKDQFVLPSYPLALEDCSEDWEPLLRRRGLETQYDDIHHRLAAMRSLFIAANLLLIPKEGGGVAEVEGPPGPKKWHMIVYGYPKSMRHLIDVLELPMENTLSQLCPFRRIVTPETETFRYDNLSYLVTMDKMPDVRYTISTLGEKLVWVSPKEAVARFNAGIMNMPTASLIALSELCNECPTYEDVAKKTATDVPREVLPELHRHGQSKVATVLLPGDLKHTATTDEDRAAQFIRRFVYHKDYPYGVRAVFEERPASTAEVEMNLEKEKPALLEEARDIDSIYAEVPYPNKRHRGSSASQAEATKRAMEYQFQEGEENADGLIPVRR